MHFILGEDLGDKSAVDSHSAAMVDANTSLLCQLHSHQQRHRLENQQFDLQSPLENLRSENDKTKLFDDRGSKKLSLLELQVRIKDCFDLHISSVLLNDKFLSSWCYSISNSTNNKFQQKNRRRYAKIDRFFLVVFPLMFVGFNVGYWIYYYYCNPMHDEIRMMDEEDGSLTTDEPVMSSTMPPEMTQDLNNDKYINWFITTK